MQIYTHDAEATDTLATDEGFCRFTHMMLKQ